MKDFRGKTAVVTGAGTGMGRELARQLAAEGCNVAVCDVLPQNMAETVALCQEAAPPGTRITSTQCDVADEAQVLAFRDAVLREHATDHIHLLFNNAGIGGGGSFLTDSREEWDRTFAVDWSGVYFCTRAFLPLLVAAPEGYIVNTSSVNGFWACLGPGVPHTAYSAAKFAVKGFTEALITDLRVNAPHVKAAVVMPGHIGTSIAINSRILHGGSVELSADEIAQARARMAGRGIAPDALSDEQIRAAVRQMGEDFRDKAPVTAAQAATIILDGVRAEQWRILVGEDAQRIDRLVRETPEEAYEMSFAMRLQADSTAAAATPGA
jgi:NAD(P)-dependent dehydrogenase (short-subunit alcohol dehydrogenase family)